MGGEGGVRVRVSRVSGVTGVTSVSGVFGCVGVQGVRGGSDDGDANGNIQGGQLILSTNQGNIDNH